MRLVLVAIQILFLALSLHADDPLASFVGAADLQKLRAGTTLKTSLAPDGALSLLPGVTSRDDIVADVRQLGPTIGAELLKIIPGPGIEMDTAEGQLLLYNTLHAVSTMKGVTYWSVSRGKDQVLFLQSYAIASPDKQDPVPDPVFTNIPVTDELFTFQEDNSFKTNTYTERFTAGADHFLVKTENVSTIRILFVPIIQPGGLVSQVVVVPAGTDVLFYGLATIRTSMPLGDREHRVESLKNRLVALSGWLARQLSSETSRSRSP